MATWTPEAVAEDITWRTWFFHKPHQKQLFSRSSFAGYLMVAARDERWQQAVALIDAFDAIEVPETEDVGSREYLEFEGAKLALLEDLVAAARLAVPVEEVDRGAYRR